MVDSTQSTIVGPSILINGNLQGDEDLTVLGRVEGTLSLTKTLNVAESGIVKADISVRNAVVSGVGTGGTLVGLYKGFRDAGCNTTPVLARPVCVSEGADYASGCFQQAECCSFSTCVPGVMDNQSEILKPEELKGLITIEVEEEEALATTRALIKKGFAVGPSSGLNYAAALETSKSLGPDSKIVTVFPDRMERYFSTALFQEHPDRQ